MDLEKISDEITSEPLLNEMWTKLVHPAITEYEISKQRVAELKPPTEEEITELINDSDEPSVEEMRRSRDEAQDLVERLTEELNTWAKASLTVAASADDVMKARQTVNRQKSQLVATLQSMEAHAERQELSDALGFIGELLEEIAAKPVTSRSVSSDTNKIREWAKENGLKVSDRGRIPADVLAAWGERDEE